jgi:DNA-directed RNA polymerase subunit RPC12/RpoP
MTFPLPCIACGHVDHVAWSQIGQKATCGRCQRTSVVPAPSEPALPAVARAIVVKFACPACGRKFATKPELAGQKIRCSRCGKGVRIPQGDTNLVTTSAQSQTKSLVSDDSRAPLPRPASDISARAEVRPRANDDGTRHDELSVSPAKPSARGEYDGVNAASSDVDLTKLREARQRRPAETVLPSRAELLEQVRKTAAEQDVVDPGPKAKKTKKKKKRKKTSGYFDPKETLKLVAGVAVFVGVLAFLAWAYPEFRFPLGGLLCVVGFITYLLGWVSIKQVVAEEGVLKALVFRFFPPYQWWFVASHWEETKDFVAFFGAGMLIMAIGSGVIKTSAVGKQAEASERAYQKAVRARETAVPPIPSKITVGDGD